MIALILWGMICYDDMENCENCENLELDMMQKRM